jgi:hypothetical protein
MGGHLYEQIWVDTFMEKYGWTLLQKNRVDTFTKNMGGHFYEKIGVDTFTKHFGSLVSFLILENATAQQQNTIPKISNLVCNIFTDPIPPDAPAYA